MNKNLLRISVVAGTIGLLLTAGGCPEETTSKKPAKVKKGYTAVASDGTFSTTVLKVNAHGTQIRALEPRAECHWSLYYEYNGHQMLLKSGDFKTPVVNLNAKKVFKDKKTGKHYTEYATTFVTNGCRTWVKR